MRGFTYSPERYRVVGIDPGTALGVAYFEIDLEMKRSALIEVNTLHGDRLSRQYPIIEEVYGGRTARNLAFEESLVQYFRVVRPHSVICESPFLKKLPQAFASLTETVASIRRAVMRYDYFRPLLMIDPPSAKRAVGMVLKKGQDKDDVKKAVLALNAWENPYGIDLASLDEHCIDAIAVGWSRVSAILEQL